MHDAKLSEGGRKISKTRVLVTLPILYDTPSFLKDGVENSMLQDAITAQEKT